MWTENQQETPRRCSHGVTRKPGEVVTKAQRRKCLQEGTSHQVNRFRDAEEDGNRELPRFQQGTWMILVGTMSVKCRDLRVGCTEEGMRVSKEKH